MAKVGLHDLESVCGRYRTIYLDPPWPYDRRPLGRRDLNEIYEGGVMGLDEIADLPVGKLGHRDARFHVFLWCTWPKMRDGYHLEVMESWGLKWVSEIVWDKKSMGVGRRFRKQTELLLVGIPKKPPPGLLFDRSDQRDIVSVRSQRGKGKHSTKPHEFRRIIETLTPGPRIELFARCHPPRWDVWGHEAPEEQEPSGRFSEQGDAPRESPRRSRKTHEPHDHAEPIVE